MKSQRRHQLQTNTLADVVGRGLEKYRNYLPQIGWAALVVVALLVVVSYWSSWRSTDATGAWRAYEKAVSTFGPDAVTKLRLVIDAYPNHEVALWAKIDLADLYTDEGKRKLDIDHDNGVARLREAQQTYAEVLKTPKVRPEMIRRAALPEAKCWELLGERDKAITAYRDIAKKYGDTLSSEMIAEANSRASDLASDEAADFYKWLAAYKPPAFKLPNPATDLAPLPPFMGGADSKNTEVDAEKTPESSSDEATSKLQAPVPEKPETKQPDSKKPDDAPDGDDAKKPAPAEKPVEKPDTSNDNGSTSESS